MIQDPWSDERLAAAFADRYDRPAPRELTRATLERIRVTPRRSRWWPTVDRPAALGLVSVVAVVAILAVFVAPRAGIAPGASIAPSGAKSPAASLAQNTPYESFPPSPAVAGFAATAAGLQVRAVTDAATLLAGPDLSDTELAFAGWYSASDRILRCAMRLEPVSPIEQPCGQRAWLSSSAVPFLAADGSWTLGGLDTSTRIDLRFVAPVDPIAGVGGPNRAMVTTPRPAVLIGHFNDERAQRCTAPTSCERTFVVDGIASTSGELRDPATSSQAATTGARLTAPEATRIARDRIAGFGQVLSVGLQQGNDAPWFASSRTVDCLCPPTWFVRGYRTLLDDGSDPRAPGTPISGWLTIDDATGAILGPLSAGIPAQPTPYPYASSPAGFPATIEGLPVRTVADLADPARPRNGDAAPFAVAGWLFHGPVASCVTLPCNQRLDVLAGTDSLAGAAGAVIYPMILPGSTLLPKPASDLAPRRVILVGHQDDPRSRPAQGSSGAPGATDFVLDQVAWLDGVDQPASVWIEPGITPTRTVTEVLAIAGDLRTGQTWRISVGAQLASEAGVGYLFAGMGDPIVWVVRMVGSNPVAGSGGLPGWGTVLVADGSGVIVQTNWTSP